MLLLLQQVKVSGTASVGIAGIAACSPQMPIAVGGELRPGDVSFLREPFSSVLQAAKKLAKGLH